MNILGFNNEQALLFEQGFFFNGQQIVVEFKDYHFIKLQFDNDLIIGDYQLDEGWINKAIDNLQQQELFAFFEWINYEQVMLQEQQCVNAKIAHIVDIAIRYGSVAARIIASNAIYCIVNTDFVEQFIIDVKRYFKEKLNESCQLAILN